MRILWLCNVMLPFVGTYLKEESSVKEGWITGTLEKIASEEKEIELGICIPVKKDLENWKDTVPFTNDFFVSCFGYSEDQSNPHIEDEKVKLRFKKIYDEFQPDIVHIFGTEYAHTLAMVEAVNNPKKVLIGIQGIISECANSYMADLPERVKKSVTFRDLVKKDTLYMQQEKFRIRGELEIKALKNAGNITGRTSFDKKITGDIVPCATYYKMNETMRGVFYEGTWSIDTCKKYQIFISQGDYPLKGLHYLLETMPFLLKQFKEVKIVIAGNSIISNKSLKDKVKRSAYGKYLIGLIKKYQLEDFVTVLGKLEEEQMKQVFLQSHIFVCPSSLENSPNSVGEAMLLGVPVVASRIGGIPDLVVDGTSGLLFEKGNIDELKSCIENIFSNDDLANALSKAGKEQAKCTHNKENNYRRLLEIYEKILKK
ncbi:MAG: glycosyltransferase family 4 protein [Lachnospiraceae bacterium]